MEKKINTFRKKLVGGFNETDVINYLKSLGEQIDKLEKTGQFLQKTVEALYDKNEADEAELQRLREKLMRFGDDSDKPMKIKLAEINDLADNVKIKVSEIEKVIEEKEKING